MPLQSRLVARQRRTAERAARLRAVVPQLAHRLAERGARRVLLFGSLAPGGQPHESSDIDLCVVGLDEVALGDAAFELIELAGVEVDLVRWEDASERLRARIDADGEEIDLGR
jgi:predicted nucleotidyltransferase